LLFPAKHPYARPLGGTPESRRGLTLAQARAYASQNFRPERMTLLVAAPPGATTLETLTGRLPPALRGDAGRPVQRAARGARPADDAAPAKAAPVERKSSPLPTPELWIGWRLPGAVGDTGTLEETLEWWLQEDVSSDQLFEEEPKIRYVRAILQPGPGASVLLVRLLMGDGADP